MTTADWARVRQIYLDGMATGNATFAQDAPSWEQWDASHLPDCRLVAREGGEVLGWAALSPVSSRCVYKGVALSQHLPQRECARPGNGSFAALQAGIFPENTASIELHRKLGFRLLGVREKIGCMNGRWRDV